MHYIKSGFVKGYDIDSQGTEQLIWLGASGDFFPLSMLFETEPTMPYFITALSDVETYAVRKNDIKEFLDNNHAALKEVTRSLAVRMINTFHHLNAAEKARAEEKIIYSLYFLARRFRESADHPMKEVVLPLPGKRLPKSSSASKTGDTSIMTNITLSFTLKN
jgi:CRP-like cAMP-binding protein